MFEKPDRPEPKTPMSVFYRGRQQKRKCYSFRKPTDAMYRKDERERQRQRKGQK